MVIWVCEASEVNNLTVLAVGPNGHNKDDKDKDKIASSRSDPPKGSDNHEFILLWRKFSFNCVTVSDRFCNCVITSWGLSDI